MDRSFSLQNSLFASWKVDLKTHLQKCLRADMRYSKIYRFVKDPAEQERIYAVLEANFATIHEHYVYGQGTSKYPNIEVADFAKLCQRWGVLGRKGLQHADIDRLFAQVNFEEVDGQQVELENNPDKDLCRYEFFEIVARMAKELFKGVPVSEAIPMLLEQYLTPNRPRQSWQGLRETEIWTLDVHDVLEVNAASLKIFFAKGVGKKAGVADFQKLLEAEVPGQGQFGWVLDITETDLVLAFANAKFPVVDEMEDFEQLTYLKFDEFLEFVCRLAVSSGLPGSLPDKVFGVIDLLLQIPGDYPPMRAVRPEQIGLGDSESDYD